MPYPSSYSYLRMDETAVVDELRFTGNVRVGTFYATTALVGRNVGGVWRLPDDLDLTFGTSSAIELAVGCHTLFDYTTHGQMNSGTGGVLRANVGTLRVGYQATGADATGSLLLGDMERIDTFSATSIEVGAIGQGGSGTANGAFSLPPGKATASSLTVGSAYSGTAAATLNGTRLAVSGTATIQKTGTLTANIRSTSAGLDLAAGPSLAIATGGKLVVNFTSAVPVFAGPYFGLKWPGDHVTELQNHKTNNRLVINTNGLGVLAAKAGIFATNDITYIGVPAQDISVVATDAGRTESHVLMTDSTIHVAVAASPFAGSPIASYAVSEAVPTNFADLAWQTSGTFTSYTLGGQGVVTLYGWAKDEADRIIGAATEILYGDTRPTLTVRPENCLTGTLTLVVAFDTDLQAVGQVGWRVKDSGAPFAWSGESLGTSHSIALTGLSAGTAYELALYANRGSSVETNESYEMTTTSPLGTADSATWTGGGSPYRQWAEGFNWVGNRPPANPTTGTLTFGTQGLLVSGLVNEDWTVGTLQFQNTSGTHIVDLGGKELTIDTLLTSAHRNAKLRFANGRLKLRGEVRAVSTENTLDAGLVALTIAPGVEVDMDAAVLVNFAGGSGSAHGAELDLSGVIAVTNGNGRRVLTMNGLQVGTVRGGYPYPTSYSYLRLDGSAVLDELRFTGNVRVGTVYGTTALVGKDEGGVWRLPHNLDLTFGASSPIELAVGCHTLYGYDTLGWMNSGTGGVLRANLSSLRVGSKATGTGTAGSLLLGDMERIDTFSATTIEVGAIGTGGSGAASGYFSLPPGEATAGALTVGSAYSGTVRMTLNGTRLAVSGTATIRKTGVVSNTVYGASSGLDVANASGLLPATAADFGALRMVFAGPKSAGSEGYWGLRLAGNHAAYLKDLNTAGKLTWNDTAVGGKVEIFTFGGNTYVGIPPPRGTLILLR